VQAFPSLHDVPFAAAGFEHVPVDGSHVPPTWQASLAAHVTGLLPTHAPPWQLSLCVHAFPSLHAVPFAATGFEHAPVDGLHVPAPWHWSLAARVTGLPPVRVPFSHVSVCVHAFPSLHAVPFAATGFEHAPVDGLHVPAPWHWSLAAQVTGLLPVHVPFWHVSVFVHALPSLQVVPLAATGLEQVPVPGSQVPAVWQESEAVQVTGLLPVQVPFWQVSVFVHALPSLQVVPLATTGFEHVPVEGLHVPAAWHASAAAQVTRLLPVQAPFWHVSVLVHALPSLHDVPLVAIGLEQAPVVGSHVPTT
jgi:hypothetical protein